MAVPDWKQMKDELLSSQMTYEQYMKLYLNDWKPIILPDWILDALGPHRRRAAEEAARWTIYRDEATAMTHVSVELYGGETVAFQMADEYMINFVPREDWPHVPTLPKLETFYSPWPVLGWRGWNLNSFGVDQGKMIGFYGHKWDTPRLEAECAKGPLAPHFAIADRCGIYLLKEPKSLVPEGFHFIGLCVSTRVIEYELGYRAGVVRCIGVTTNRTLPPDWKVPIMSPKELDEYERSLIADPDSIPAP